MNQNSHQFNDKGKSFVELITTVIEEELVKRANKFYNSGKDIAASTKEDK